jgi:glycosyltransferase involved in cell wall biosynthesis
VPEVVTDGRDGVLLQPGDPEAFAHAVRALVHDGSRRRAIAERAAARAQDFDIARTQADLEGRYRRLLQRGT